MSKKIVKTLLLLIFSIGLTAGAAIFYYSTQIAPVHKNTQEQLNTMNEIMNANLHIVYVAAKDLETGEVLDAEDVIEDSQYITNINSLITAEDIGKILIADIPSGSTIPKAVVTDVKNGEHEWLVEYSCFRLSPVMKKGSYIDVRIRFQNGEDYIVLSKKQIQSMTETGGCYLSVIAEEMQMMASAIVDANLYDASLYATLYINPTVQEPAPVNYIPNFANPALFQELYTEENMQLRKDLVGRVSNSFSIDADNTNDATFGDNIDNTSEVPVN